MKSNAWKSIVLDGNLIFPDEFVVRFLAVYHKNIAENQHKTAVDLGCGVGRHLNLLSLYGFNTVGVDFNEEAFTQAERNFPHLTDKSKNTFFCGGNDKYLEQGHPVDVAINWGAMLFQSMEKLIETLKLVHSNLVDGGYFCFDLRSKDTWFYGLGEEISPNYFMLDERAKSYQGIPYLFVDKNDIIEIANKSGFTIECMEEKMFTKNNMTEKQAWYMLVFKK